MDGISGVANAAAAHASAEVPAKAATEANAVGADASSGANTDKADKAQVSPAKSPPATANLYPLFKKVEAKLKSPDTPKHSSGQSLLTPDVFKQVNWQVKTSLFLAAQVKTHSIMKNGEYIVSGNQDAPPLTES